MDSKIEKGDYVNATYKGVLYPGKVLSISEKWRDMVVQASPGVAILVGFEDVTLLRKVEHGED